MDNFTRLYFNQMLIVAVINDTTTLCVLLKLLGVRREF